MKAKEIWLAAIFLCMFPALSCGYEEDYKKIGRDVNVPDSMDVVKEADVNVMVPKGGRLRKESSFLIKEDADEYASRKFIDLEARFSQIEKEVESQKKDIKSLKETVEKVSQQKK